MTDNERAGWLADKLHNGGDYGKEAAGLLIAQAAEIDRLRAALAAAQAPQQPARVALTIPQIKEIWAQHPELSDPGFVLVPFVRAVERAHGIPGTDGAA